MTDKPKRLDKFEDTWTSRSSAYVEFWESGGLWFVTLDGRFSGHEIKDIGNALITANKRKPLPQQGLGI